MSKPRTLAPESAARPVQACLAKLIEFRFSEIAACRTGVYTGTVEGVHDMRVSCRRLQAILRAFGDFFPEKCTKKFRRWLRGLIIALGEVREYDVLIDHIVRTVRASSIPQQTALGLLVGRYSLLRTRSHGALTLALRTIEEKNVFGAFRSAVTLHLKKRDEAPVSFGSLLQKTVPDFFLSFMVASSQVVNHPRRAVALHRLRIRGKPLRYTMELSQACFGQVYNQCYKEMKSVIELLGDIHDIDVTANTLSSYLEEIRIVNTPAYPLTSISIQTGFLRTAIASLKTRRRELFTVLSAKILNWRRQGFYGRVMRSLARKQRRAAKVRLIKR